MVRRRHGCNVTESAAPVAGCNFLPRPLLSLFGQLRCHSRGPHLCRWPPPETIFGSLTKLGPRSFGVAGSSTARGRSGDSENAEMGLPHSSSGAPLRHTLPPSELMSTVIRAY